MRRLSLVVGFWLVVAPSASADCITGQFHHPPKCERVFTARAKPQEWQTWRVGEDMPAATAFIIEDVQFASGGNREGFARRGSFKAHEELRDGILRIRFHSTGGPIRFSYRFQFWRAPTD